MTAKPHDGARVEPRRIHELAVQIESGISDAIGSIEHINLRTRLLAMNTRVEASRLGESGRAIGVIGGEMVELAKHTGDAASALGTRTRSVVDELVQISAALSSQVRGTRLGDLALTNIDLIDRNLYERSCDVRWWATDPSFVQALADPSAEASGHASRRMGEILKAYTVYFDIVLADAAGVIVANGRPDKFRSAGQKVAGSAWFTQAAAAASGDVFGFQGMHESALAGGARALVYSAKVRVPSGRGAAPGVLGIVFNWDGLARPIVEGTPVDAAERAHTRSLIVDSHGAVLADSRAAGGALARSFSVEGVGGLARGQKGHLSARVDGKASVVGYAASPGFETYATGWHSFVLYDGA